LIADEHYSRYEPHYANEYWQAFLKTQSLFYGIAYPIADKALVTHAGVTKDHNIIFVDCLGTKERSYIIEV
jgi:hypothetical protein